jgi:hypothetical protein
MIILVVTGLCIYIQIYLRRHIIGLASIGNSSSLLSKESGTSAGTVPLNDITNSSNDKPMEGDEEKIIGEELSGFGHEITHNQVGFSRASCKLSISSHCC